MLSLLLLLQASAFDGHPLAKPFKLNPAQQAQIKEAVGEQLKDPFSRNMTSTRSSTNTSTAGG
jgi:hypothetical protein